jgi:hypothetical protein
MEDEQMLFYKTDVKFTIAIRFSNQDRNGMVLNARNPYVAIKKSQSRDFLQANKEMIQKGYLVSCEEPIVNMETPNAISDEQGSALVKSFFTLKKTLPTIDSAGTLIKLREIALADGRTQKTIALIDERLSEVEPVEKPIDD